MLSRWVRSGRGFCSTTLPIQSAIGIGSVFVRRGCGVTIIGLRPASIVFTSHQVERLVRGARFGAMAHNVLRFFFINLRQSIVCLTMSVEQFVYLRL